MEYKIAFDSYTISSISFRRTFPWNEKKKKKKIRNYRISIRTIFESVKRWASSREIRFYVTGIRLRQINEPKTFYASNARITIGYLSFAPICECGHVARVITNCWTSFEQLPHALEIFSMESRLSITAHYETALPFPPSPLPLPPPPLNPF